MSITVSGRGTVSWPQAVADGSTVTLLVEYTQIDATTLLINEAKITPSGGFASTSACSSDPNFQGWWGGTFYIEQNGEEVYKEGGLYCNKVILSNRQFTVKMGEPITFAFSYYHYYSNRNVVIPKFYAGSENGVDWQYKSTISAQDTVVGNPVVFSMSRTSTEITHKLTLQIKDKTPVVIVSDAGVSYSYPTDYSFYNKYFTSTETFVNCKVTCESLWKGTSLGTEEATFKLLIHDGAGPVLTPSISFPAKYSQTTGKAVSELTGSATKGILNFSKARATVNVGGQYGATIASYTVRNGKTSGTSVTVEPLTDKNFVFAATDSRGLTTTQTVQANVVDYVLPVVRFEITPPHPVTGLANIKIEGNFWNGNFGAVKNYANLRVDAIFEGIKSETLLEPVISKDGSFTCEAQILLAKESQSTVQVFVLDQLVSANSDIQKVFPVPVFEWGKADFQFNVPVVYTNIGRNSHLTEDVASPISGITVGGNITAVGSDAKKGDGFASLHLKVSAKNQEVGVIAQGNINDTELYPLLGETAIAYSTYGHVAIARIEASGAVKVALLANPIGATARECNFYFNYLTKGLQAL